jgi:hypothetical protein
MGRKITKKGLREKLWKIFSKYIRLRDGKCVTCGGAPENAGHYIPKSVTRLSLYFDERNVNAQCVRCNKYLSGNLQSYAIYLEKKFGYGILEQLQQERTKVFKPYPGWWEEKIEEYEEKYKKLLTSMNG